MAEWLSRQPIDPSADCIKGRHEDCHLYDDMIEDWETYLEETTPAERKMNQLPDDLLLMRDQPVFCVLCCLSYWTPLRKRERRQARRQAIIDILTFKGVRRSQAKPTRKSLKGPAKR